MADKDRRDQFSGLEKFISGERLHLDDVITSAESNSFTPVTKRNIAYIVAAVIFNDEKKVLLMQEAKSSCRGLWYLPAGRMEQGESIVEGTKREVLEETGLEFEPSALVCVEAQGTLWYRFTFTGHVTGGQLKTPADGDKESLQAQWFPVSEVFHSSSRVPLRATDIVQLVKETVKFHDLSPDVKHGPALPILHSHNTVILRLLFIWTEKQKSEGASPIFYVRRNTDNGSKKQGGLNLPSIAINPRESSLHVTVMRLMQSVFEGRTIPSLHGVVSLEHSVNSEAPSDGVCLNIMCSVVCKVDKDKPPGVKLKNYAWIPSADRERDALSMVMVDGGTVTFTLR